MEEKHTELVEEQGNGNGSSDIQGIPFTRLFHFADAYDYALMIIGTAGSVVHGLIWPAFFLFLGNIVDAYGTNQENPSEMATKVAKFSIDLVYVGAVAFISSWAAFLQRWSPVSLSAFYTVEDSFRYPGYNKS